jgi:hypothetical protein
MRINNLIIFCLLLSGNTFAATAAEPCTVLYIGSGSEISSIHEPGVYCLMENIHARMDFADHSPEEQLISIWSSDVVLDLKGHTLGRGRIFKTLGGIGILLNDDISNITIKNGTLKDFQVGIYREAKDTIYSAKNTEPLTYNPQTKTYHSKLYNLTFQNIQFKNNKNNIVIQKQAAPRQRAP